MTTGRAAGSRLKIYNDRTYVHTTLVRHQGTTVALALDDRRRLYYSVLDLDAAVAPPAGEDENGNPDLDVRHWAEDPKELVFPREIARAGYAALGAALLPKVREGGRVEQGPDDFFRDDETDPFLSSTARLTASAPFQALSDGRHVFVFRQAVGATDPDALYRTPDGRKATGAAEGNRVIAPDALLCDRFVMAGGELKPVQEVRYRRSRHRDRPETAKDSLGTTDMDGNPFLEPTLELGFAGRVTDGRFTVLLVPTAVADVQRWQFFVHNAKAQRIDAINVEQGEDGLFHTQGTRFYTSPEPQHRDSVLERAPGTCPFSGKPLVPVTPETTFAESALRFLSPDSKPYGKASAPAAFGTGAYTIEAWVKPTAKPATLIATDGGLALSTDADGKLVLAHGPTATLAAGTGTDAGTGTAVPLGTYVHVCAVYDGTHAALYAGDQLVASGPLAAAGTPTKVFFGCKTPEEGPYFTGYLDEFRLWSRARKPERIAATRGERLVGDEPGLVLYYRFDEGKGDYVYDQSDSGLDGYFSKSARWTASDAPVADHPGIRRDSFRISGRSTAGGLSAVLLHQQEDARTGHDGRTKPLKRQARVLLTWLVSATGKDTDKTNRIAALDVAVARDGRLAQIKDVLQLPTVGSGIEEVDPAEENRLNTEIARLRKDIEAAEADLENLRQDIEHPGRIREAFRSALGRATTAIGSQRKAGTSTPCRVYFDNDTDIRLLRVADPDGDKDYEVATAVELADPADASTRWNLVWGSNSLHTLVSPGTDEVLARDGSSVVLRRSRYEAVYVDFQARGSGYRTEMGFKTGGETKATVERGYGNVLDWDGRNTKLVMGQNQGGRVAVYCVADTPSDDDARKAAEALAAAGRRRDLVANGPANLTAHTDRVTGLKSALATKEERLGRITGGTKGRSDRVLPMAQLGQDATGLGWTGAVLDFATASGTPFLADSGTGHVGLYYRDARDRFTGIFYDTAVGRAGKVLTATDSVTVRLAARDAALDLGKVTVTVAADTVGPFADRCTLTLSGGGIATETWKLLPRNTAALVNALNGVRAEPVPVGTAASFKDGVLTLADPGARRALTAGDLLDVGGTLYALTGAVAAKDTELRLTHGPSTATIPAGAAVRLVSYAPELVTHDVPGSGGEYGSRSVTAALIGGVTGAVRDGTASDEGEARPSRWWGDLPGRALRFAAETEPPALPAANLQAARHADDLTVEAWVKPSAVPADAPARDGDGSVRVLHAHPGADSAYTLALGAPNAAGERQLVAGVGQAFAAGRALVPADTWTHVAAVFEQSWALRFARGVHGDTPHTDDLNIAKDLTLEVFLQTGGLGAAQGLLSKGRIDDGRGRRVPYQFGIEADGRLFFAFEDASGAEVRLNSSGRVKADTCHRIGIVRKIGDNREEMRVPKELASSGGASAAKAVAEFVDSIVVRQWSDITFHIDGAEAGRARYDQAPDLGHPGALDIGRGRRGGGDHPFTGVIGEVRIWNTARAAKEVGADLPVTDDRSWGGQPLRPEGLIAHWRFEEKLGNAAADSAGSHQVRLHGVKWVKNPDPRGSTFRLYVNGRATQHTLLAAADAPAGGAYGAEQFALGGRTDATGQRERFTGVLEEVRVWRRARTEEQILDNLFGRLIGDAPDLIASYAFDDESTEADATTLRDQGPRALDLTLSTTAAARPSPLMSTAPISSDSPEVRPVFATGQPSYVQTIAATPAVGEYADLQRNRDGSTRGVLKRAYAFVQDGAWNLVTGYKLGDLKSEWVGQAQFDPQLMGYIEGAPPIPSENLVATRRLSSLSYINATSVEFQQADQVVQTLSSGGESTVDTSLAFQLANNADSSTLMIQAPLGIGVATPMAQFKYDVRGGATLEFSNAWGDQTDVSEGVNTARSTTVGLSGGWEPDDAAHQIDPTGGRRFMPVNTGYALVQSETADVFALRVEHSGAVVAYRMLPNPDIPRDWNLLPFALNPRYVKQGTLDGSVGFTDRGKLLDPSYQDAADYGEYSYFKPKEAYALKRRITEDQQRRQAYYAGVSTETHDPDPTAERARELLSRFTGPVPGPGPDRKGRDEAGVYSRRDLVNTYVWSADGGFFAETTETTDVVTETTSGSYRFNGMGTMGISGDFKAFGIGIGFQVDAALGGGINRTRSKAKESTRTFGLNVMVDTPGDMQKYDKDGNPEYENGTAVEVPGRVDAYRFMTFYLDSDKANFEDFYGKVVDRQWLEGADPNAAALRQARQSEAKPPCWRILHRVTFVSRKLPPVAPAGATKLEKAMRGADVASNYELVRRLEPFIDPAVRSRDELTRQIRDAITVHLPELAGYTDRISSFYADFYGLPDTPGPSGPSAGQPSA
ncbi:LamG-like jellyroll fold domain-containing protein [Streptomyces sp. NPDC090077]|uniref:LamG-like jellyroll fold domain-containing protein n=1 Tax=Streptomyces sp. NPDC090077 TaxID=3365938 RepID=UPI00382026C4